MLDEKSRISLAPGLPICRLLTGLWQVSGGHGVIDPRAAVSDMLAYHHQGYTTWDLADHYGPAEDLIGLFRRALRAAGADAELARVQACTKWVPQTGPMPREKVAAAVDRSLRRMEVERLDLLHFHWWDYDDGRYLDALEGLAEERTRGRIAQLGLTNFDSAHVREIRERGIPVITNQVQYSLIDRRPAALMAPYCVENGVRLLTYGTLCGGLLSETYLGKPEPALRDLNTFSLRKYKPMVDAWGGWALFQELLQALSVIAKRHGASIGNVAVRSILDQPGVAGVIVGARLGLSEHRSSNERVFHLRLDDEDRERIDIVEKRSRDLLPIIGDCGAEYR